MSQGKQSFRILLSLRVMVLDQQYLNEKLIQIDRKMFTSEALTSMIMREFQIKAISPRFYQAILAFSKTQGY